MADQPRTTMMLIAEDGRIIRADMAVSDAQAVKAWYNDPGSAPIPVNITDAHGQVRSFLPTELLACDEVASTVHDDADEM